jgi:hypothetical protein
MTTEDKKPIGRPRKISSPEEMDRLVDEYVAMCRNPENPQPILLTGMILHLGLSSRDSFDEYKKYDGFSNSVKRAKMIVEMEYEGRLVTGSSAPAASIFALKNFGWKDRHEIGSDEEGFKLIHSVERRIVRPKTDD